MLVPGQPLLLVGCEVLFIGLVVWIIAIVLDTAALRKTEVRYRRAFILNIVLS